MDEALTRSLRGRAAVRAPCALALGAALLLLSTTAVGQAPDAPSPPPAGTQLTSENPGPHLLPPPKLGPPILPYEAGQPIPPGYIVSPGPPSKLIVPGAAIAGLAYGAILIPTLFFTVALPIPEIEKGAWAFYIPLAGPFIGASLLDAGAFSGTLFFTCGIAQNVGTALAIIGASLPDDLRLVRASTASRVTISPGAAGAPGVSLRLSF